MDSLWLFQAIKSGSHRHVTVRCGPDTGHRPLLGTLIMEEAEWRELRDALLASPLSVSMETLS